MTSRFVLKAATATLAALALSVLGACTEDSDSEVSPNDTAAPMITAATATVDTDAVVLSATVSDNIAVTRVEFQIDRNAKATVTDVRGQSSVSTSIPLRLLSKGTHSMVARAVDAAGNTTVTDEVTFQIGQPEESPIKITITPVQDGPSVTFTIDIESEAVIKLSNFFLDGEFLGGRGDDQRHYVLTRVLSTGTHRFGVDVSDVEGHSNYAEVVVNI